MCCRSKYERQRSECEAASLNVTTSLNVRLRSECETEI